MGFLDDMAAEGPPPAQPPRKSSFLAQMVAEGPPPVQEAPAASPAPEGPKGFLASLYEGAGRVLLGLEEGAGRELRSLGEGVGAAAELATGGKPQPGQLAPDRLAEIRNKPVLERFTDSDFVGDFLGSVVVGSMPFLAGATGGAVAGAATPVPGGALIGGAVGGGLAVALQSVGPAYLEARRAGQDHEAAVDTALEQAAVQGTIAGATVPLAAFRPFRTAISNGLFQLVAQPAADAGSQVASNAMTDRPLGTGVPEAIIGSVAFETPAMLGALRATGAIGPLAREGAFTPTETPARIGQAAELDIGGVRRTVPTEGGTALPSGEPGAAGVGGAAAQAPGIPRETPTPDQVQAEATDAAFGPTDTVAQTEQAAAARSQAEDLAARGHEKALAEDRARQEQTTVRGIGDYSTANMTPEQVNARIAADQAQAAAGDAAAADSAQRWADEYEKRYFDVVRNAESQVFDQLEAGARAAMEGARWPAGSVEEATARAAGEDIRAHQTDAFRDQLSQAMDAAGEAAIANDVRRASALELRDAAEAIVAEREGMARQTAVTAAERAAQAAGEAAAGVQGQGPPQGPPTPPRSRSGLVGRVLGALAVTPRAIVAGPREVFSQWAKPLTQRVGDTRVPVAKPLEQAGLRAIDETNRLIGRWQIQSEPYLKLLQGGRVALRGERRAQLAEGRTARRELNERVPVKYEGAGPLVEYGYTKFQRGVENEGDLVRLSPPAQRAVRKFREFMQTTARDIEAVRTPMGEPIMMVTAEGSVPFHGARDGARLIRQWTPEMWRIMQLGEGSPGYRALGQALAHANGLSEEVSFRTLSALRTATIERSSAVEIARVFREFPTYIRVAKEGGRGYEIPLLHTDPFAAVGHVTRNLAQRVGYIKEFGQNLGDGKSFGEEGVQRFESQGGVASDAIEMIRALQGIPIDQPSHRFAPGTPEYEALRTVDTLRETLNAGLLSRSFIPNLTEPVSKTPMITGGRAATKAFVGLLTHPKYRTAMLEEVAERGFRTIDVFDWMKEPGRGREYVARLARQTLNAAGMKVNEWNEMHAAVSALEKVKKLEAGRGTALDRARLEMLRFKPDEIDTVMGGLRGVPEAEAGKVTELYNRVGRRMVEYSQGTTAQPANLSRLTNKRVYRWIFNFDRYAQMTANRFQRHVSGTTKALWEKGPLSPEFRARATLLSGFLLGHTASGIGAVLLTDMIRDGWTGVEDRTERAGKTLKDFSDLVGSGFRYASLSGAGDITMRAMEAPTAKEGLASIGSSTVPGRYFVMASDWANGQGPFKNLDGTDAALRLIESNVPIAPAFVRLAAQLGLADKKNPRREVAIKRMWEWVRKNQGTGTGAVAEDPEADVAAAIAKRAEFSVALGKLERAIRLGRPPQELDPLRNAAALAGSTFGVDAHAALLGKRLITKIQVKNQPAARQWLGEENWQALHDYDSLLEYWADGLPTGR